MQEVEQQLAMFRPCAAEGPTPTLSLAYVRPRQGLFVIVVVFVTLGFELRALCL
jgi:hypothetical protein